VPRARWDLLVRGGRVVDPCSGVDGRRDVAVSGGRIAAVAPSVAGSAETTVDAAGQLVLPGLVDAHVHLAAPGAAAAGHRMLARAGVTTALDLAGPVEAFLDAAGSHGAGLTVACVDLLRPGTRARASIR
jgi:dihydroorotase-like cyclic amidohydrolase